MLKTVCLGTHRKQQADVVERCGLTSHLKCVAFAMTKMLPNNVFNSLRRRHWVQKQPFRCKNDVLIYHNSVDEVGTNISLGHHQVSCVLCACILSCSVLMLLLCIHLPHFSCLCCHGDKLLIVFISTSYLQVSLVSSISFSSSLLFNTAPMLSALSAPSCGQCTHQHISSI